MIVLIVGTVGGVGTTTLATNLLRQGVPAIGLDLADGMLAGRIERRIFPLEQAVFSRENPLVQINRIIARQPVLVWTPGCMTDPGRVWDFVRDLAKRSTPIIADGGLEPPAGVWELATIAFAVSRKDDPVAAWHEQQLRQAHPGLHVVTGALQAAGSAIAEQVFAEQLAQRPAQGKSRILKWLRSQ